MEYLWQFFSYFGDVAYWLGFTISFLIIYPFLYENDKKKFNWILYFLLPSVLISYASAFLLKEYFKVPRVCLGIENCPPTYAFPSGHATIAASFFTIVYLVFRNKTKLWLPVLLLSLLVCYSRIALGVHTLIDVIGGFFLGLSISLVWFKLYSRVLEIKRSDFTLRKLIHLSAIFLIPLYFHVNHKYLILLLSSLSLAYFISEILRLRKIYIPILQDITIKCRKNDEKGFVYSPLLYSLSLLLLLFFPKEAFLAGSIGLVVGDGFAGLIGYWFGKNKIPYNRNKSLEGSFSFFFSTFLVYLLFFSPLKSLILALIGTLIESFSRKEENLLLPISLAIFSLLVNV